MAHNSLHRFSDRVDNYVLYRPRYPQEIFDFMQAEGILPATGAIADVGSGTGISAEPLLRRGYKVYGVEPNAHMRAAAEKQFANEPLFESINGTAEHTTLPAHSVDAVISGQAFHWFDRPKTREEFRRIMRPGAYAVLMWNDRRIATSDFLKVYEDFLQMFGTDYKEINHKNIQDPKILDEFFGKGQYREKSVDNSQEVDFAGFKGRVLSSSYIPAQGHPDYEHMLYVLKKIFMRYQHNGTVRIEYDTRIYYGQLN